MGTVCYSALFFSITFSTFCARAIDAADTFRLGVENISESDVQWLQTHPIALITNHTGKDQRGRSTIDILIGKRVKIVAILAPEHGLAGTIAAEHAVGDSMFQGIPVISIYGAGAGKSLPEKFLKTVDGFVFDIQDVGMRHYTYTATLYSMLKTAAHHNKRFMVLDRPNPLGSLRQGPIPSAQILATSFVSSVPVPVRHGLTVGELAQYLVRYHLPDVVALRVVPMVNYTRDMPCPPQLVAHVSPNINGIDACYGYSFLGLLGEVRPFDVGIGTPLAFRCITMPHDVPCSAAFWPRVQKLLKEYAVDSKPYTYFSQRKKKQCTGLQLHISNINQLQSFECLMSLLELARDLGIPLKFSPYFDTAVGTPMLRDCIHKRQSCLLLQNSIDQQLSHLAMQVEPILLY